MKQPPRCKGFGTDEKDSSAMCFFEKMINRDGILGRAQCIDIYNREWTRMGGERGHI